MKVTHVGVDLAKDLFQVHGVEELARQSCAGGCGAARWRSTSSNYSPA